MYRVLVQKQFARVSKTAEVQFELITWVSSEAMVIFGSSCGRPSCSLFVDICKWYVNEQQEKNCCQNGDWQWIFWVNHCGNEDQWCLPMKLRWWTQTLPQVYRIHVSTVDGSQNFNIIWTYVSINQGDALGLKGIKEVKCGFEEMKEAVLVDSILLLTGGISWSLVVLFEGYEYLLNSVSKVSQNMGNYSNFFLELWYF